MMYTLLNREIKRGLDGMVPWTLSQFICRQTSLWLAVFFSFCEFVPKSALKLSCFSHHYEVMTFWHKSWKTFFFYLDHTLLMCQIVRILCGLSNESVVHNMLLGVFDKEVRLSWLNGLIFFFYEIEDSFWIALGKSVMFYSCCACITHVSVIFSPHQFECVVHVGKKRWETFCHQYEPAIHWKNYVVNK